MSAHPSRCAVLLLAALLLVPLHAQATAVTSPALPPLTFASPAGSVAAVVGVEPDGRLWYSVWRGDRPVNDRSPLGVIVDGADLGAGVSAVYATDPAEHRDTYPTRGVHTEAVDHYREVVLVVLRTGAGDAMTWIVLRAYDDGVAYRYGIPGVGTRTIGGEASAWRLLPGTLVWLEKSTANYEKPLELLEAGAVDTDAGGPIAFAMADGGAALITEASLRHYSGMTYRLEAGSLLMRGEFLDDATWTVAAGSVSPWRVVLTAASLNGLVNSDLIGNLNEPPDPATFPQGAGTPWIRPGRAVWSWLYDSAASASFDRQQQLVDYAAALRAEFVTVDAGWEYGFPTATANQFDRLGELVSYGRRHRPVVAIWVWKAWQELEDATARREFFRDVHVAGAVGVKIDDIFGDDSDSKAKVELQEAILRDAAAERLMINFHGVNKATGLSRTFPNEITREGFMGLEPNVLWFDGLYVQPRHNAALPFTRFVAGPGDYTPLLIDSAHQGLTTLAHQLALTGVLTSPLVHFAENPAVILATPAARELVRTLPTEWDETVVLPPSVIGGLAILARRRDQRWYIFAVSGDDTHSQPLHLDLRFLPRAQYDAILMEDETHDSVTRREVQGLSLSGAIDTTVLPGGGFVAILSPAPDRSRPVLQGFTSLPPSDTTGGRLAAYAVLREHADLVAHSLQDGVPWPEAFTSSDMRTYPANLRADWERRRSYDTALIPDHARYLMLNPIDTATYAGLAPYWGEQPQLPLPAPWSALEFDDPAVKTAFLNYAIAAVEYFQPTYVAIGIESNILLLKAPVRWGAYKALNAYVYTQLKARYPSLQVFATVHYEHMMGMSGEAVSMQILMRDWYPDVLTTEVLSLLEHSDLLALSTYPFMVAGNAFIDQDGHLDPDYYQGAYDLAALAGKRLAIDQSGDISRDLYLEYLGASFHGTEEGQDDFVGHLLRDAHVYDFDFLINFVGWDYGENYGTVPTSVTWAYTGLVRPDGSAKPALATWDSYREPR